MKALMFPRFHLASLPALQSLEKTLIQPVSPGVRHSLLVGRSVCGSKGVFTGRLPDSSQPPKWESSLSHRYRLLVFLNALA
ncbi:hypothetical protein [Sphaerochaeta sp. PS]|uniref:hypothetical protein n=1 Tax=Sphaerochaeta sp. PS TaxID=3076336 RepID=UPI0028A30226|nr:hypothetical protein [Sphaerochaeta sp. PS]MDT4762674.1 hypothetical protein [Sphaerochaeta sp. PS]